MSTEDNKALVRHYLEEIYRGNLAILDEVIGDEFNNDPPPGVTPAEHYQRVFGAFRRAFPDIQIRFAALIAEGDQVAMHCTLAGTHLGEWRGIPPTGKPITWTATAFRRVRDGTRVEGLSSWDTLSALEQLGATVTPPAPTATPPSAGRTAGAGPIAPPRDLLPSPALLRHGGRAAAPSSQISVSVPSPHGWLAPHRRGILDSLIPCAYPAATAAR